MRPHERSAALEHGVRGDRRAVQDRVEVGKADARAVGGEADALDHADGLVLGVLGVFASQTRWASLS